MTDVFPSLDLLTDQSANLSKLEVATGYQASNFIYLIDERHVSRDLTQLSKDAAAISNTISIEWFRLNILKQCLKLLTDYSSHPLATELALWKDVAGIAHLALQMVDNRARSDITTVKRIENQMTVVSGYKKPKPGSSLDHGLELDPRRLANTSHADLQPHCARGHGSNHQTGRSRETRQLVDEDPRRHDHGIPTRHVPGDRVCHAWPDQRRASRVQRLPCCLDSDHCCHPAWLGCHHATSSYAGSVARCETRKGIKQGQDCRLGRRNGIDGPAAIEELH